MPISKTIGEQRSERIVVLGSTSAVIQTATCLNPAKTVLSQPVEGLPKPLATKLLRTFRQNNACVGGLTNCSVPSEGGLEIRNQAERATVIE